MNIIRTVLLFMIFVTLTLGVSAQVELVPTRKMEYGDLSELGTGRMRVFVHTENLESRGKILKELAKYPRLEIVGRFEEADFFLVYGSALIGTGPNQFNNDFADPASLTVVYGDLVALKLVDDPHPSEVPDGKRTRIIWYAHKRQTIVRTDQWLRTSQFGASGTKASLISSVIGGLLYIIPKLAGIPTGHSPEIKATRAFIKDLRKADEHLAKVNSTPPAPSPRGAVAIDFSQSGLRIPRPEPPTSTMIQQTYLPAFVSVRRTRQRGPASVARNRRRNYLKSRKQRTAAGKTKRHIRTFTPRRSHNSGFADTARHP